MNQKEIFLNGEGDAWFERNQAQIKKIKYEEDSIVKSIIKIKQKYINIQNIIEVGCGGGERLSYLKNTAGFNVHGIDPSTEAIKNAQKLNITATIGTADKLIIESKSIDVLILGFCLYLCDDEDLFKIAFEVDRVLKNNSWLIIKDFEAGDIKYNKYKHTENIQSRKMNYSKMFLWHPNYSLVDKNIEDHEAKGWTDINDNWVATTTIRKFV